MDRERADAFTTLTQLLAKSPHHGFGTETAAIAQFLGELEALRKHGPLYQIKLETNSKVPKSAQKFVGEAQYAFDLRQRQSDLQSSLKKLIRSCDSEKNRHLPGARLLRNEADRWLEYLKHFQAANKSASLRIHLSPALDLPQELSQTWHSETGEVNLDLDLVLINDGQLPITSIAMLFPSNGDFQLTIKESGDAALSSDGLRLIELRSVIEVGESRVIKLCLKHTEEAKVDIRARYKCFPDPDRPNRESSFSFRLTAPAAIDKNALRNPYIPDVPLTIEWHWQELMKGGHQRLIADIAKDLQNTTAGRVYVIRGVKRTGKTSTLRCLLERMRRTPGYFPVYIDIYSWQLALREKGARIDGENLLYELADSALTEAEYAEPKLAEEPKQKLSADLQESACRMRYEQFEAFIRELSIALNNACVVFILDELDSWIEAREFEKDAQNLLEQMRRLAINMGERSAVIISHDWQGHNWQRTYNLAKLTPILLRRVDFLERADIKALCALTSPLPYTEVAIEFIWRATGGWPGLVQFVLYRLIEEAWRAIDINGDRKFLVDITITKKVISNILQSADDRPFLTYFLKSFDADEIKVLQTLAAAQLVRKDSYQIAGVRRSREEAFVYEGELPDEIISSRAFENALASLYSKQIIESVGEDHQGHHQCKLRVGLLAYPGALKLV